MRDAENGKHLLPLGSVGQIELISGDILHPDSYREYIKNSYAVINLVGILFEKYPQSFDNIHEQKAGTLAGIAKSENVTKFIHFSALAVDKSKKSSKYAHSKFYGEVMVKNAFPDATIIRPSVIFGKGDNFINLFAGMLKLGIVPLIGGGKTLFQPVFVGDVATATLKILQDKTLTGEVYELAGDEVLSMRNILDLIAKTTNHQPTYIPIPFWIANIMGRVLSLLPSPPLTGDQVRLLKFDNIKDKYTLGLDDLSIKPHKIANVIAGYLGRFAK